MIRVQNVSKTFSIPHEKKMTLKEHLLGAMWGRKSRFEPLRALQGVDFDVHRGEFFSVIGKNGSGKSTLLKIMARIYAPDKGTVLVDGSLSPFLELGIAFNPNLTARENVFLSGAVIGLRRREIEALYDEIIGFAELERFQDQALKNFSSGMKVRLAFSVAFKVDADVLLIDEVLAVGDASFREKCYDVFRRLKGEGKTIVFVSHSMGDVKQFSDRVMLLHEGKVVSIGDPEKVIHDYQLLTAYEDEKRIALEERARQERAAARPFVPPVDERRWGSGAARLGAVSLLDGEGREKHVFATGERLRVRVPFRVERAEAAELTAAICIRRADGVNVLELRSEPFYSGETGAVELVFHSFDLLAATYSIDVGLFPAKGAEPFDYIKDCLTIRTFQDNEGIYAGLNGISYLAHDWLTTGQSEKSKV